MGVRLVVGLGNPGREHLFDRHNLGFMVVDLLAHELGFTLHTRRDLAVGRANVDGAAVAFLKPLTFMNLSGLAVQQYTRTKSIEPRDVLVVADDFNLKLGTLRLRVRGSSGGHKGLESIAQSLKTEEFPRLRVGIGPVPAGEDALDFVLRRFSREDAALLAGVKKAAAAVVLRAIRTGVENLTLDAAGTVAGAD